MTFPVNITKKIQINFHKKIGLKSGFGYNKDNYGTGAVYSLRFNWSTLSVTVMK